MYALVSSGAGDRPDRPPQALVVGSRSWPFVRAARLGGKRRRTGVLSSGSGLVEPLLRGCHAQLADLTSPPSAGSYWLQRPPVRDLVRRWRCWRLALEAGRVVALAAGRPRSLAPSRSRGRRKRQDPLLLPSPTAEADPRPPFSSMKTWNAKRMRSSDAGTSSTPRARPWAGWRPVCDTLRGKRKPEFTPQSTRGLRRRRQRREDLRDRKQAPAEALLPPLRYPAVCGRERSRSSSTGVHRGRRKAVKGFSRVPAREPPVHQAEGLRGPDHPHEARTPNPCRVMSQLAQYQGTEAQDLVARVILLPATARLGSTAGRSRVLPRRCFGPWPPCRSGPPASRAHSTSERDSTGGPGDRRRTSHGIAELYRGRPRASHVLKREDS